MDNLTTDSVVEGGDGNYTGVLSERWSVWLPHGGFMMGMCLRAVAKQAHFSAPVSLACHFLSAPAFGPVQIQVLSLRRSRTAESFRVAMSQAGKPIIELLVWTADPVGGFEHGALEAPDVPHWRALQPNDDIDGALPSEPFWRNVEQRSVDGVHWQQSTSGPPRQRDWVRLRGFEGHDDAFLDAARAVVLLDTYAWPAAAHAHVGEPEYIAPTVAFSAEFHHSRFSDWLISDAYAPIAHDGRIAFCNRLWSDRGDLVASASGTLMCRPRPGYTP